LLPLGGELVDDASAVSRRGWLGVGVAPEFREQDLHGTDAAFARCLRQEDHELSAIRNLV